MKLTGQHQDQKWKDRPGGLNTRLQSHIFRNASNPSKIPCRSHSQIEPAASRAVQIV